MNPRLNKACSPPRSRYLPRLLLLVSLLLLSRAALQAQTNKPAASAYELHGGIEISPKVVRAIALRIADDEEGYQIKVLYSESLIPTNTYPKDGRLTPEYVRELGATVQRASERLRTQYQIPPAQIYIIGLSDLHAQNPDDLIKEVRTRTGQTMTLLDAETEVQLSIAGIIPRRYRAASKWYDNRSVAMLVDVGSSSVRGGYQQLRRGANGRANYDYVTWEIPKGTTVFAGEVNKAVSEQSDLPTFARRAQELSDSGFKNLLRMEEAKKTGLLARRKIYVTGGVLWALVTLLYPEDQRAYIPLTIADINTFFNRAIADPDALFNPDLSKIRDETVRNEVRRSREAVKAAFTPRTLLAGTALLKTLAGELDFAERRVIYVRHSYLARILSYVRLQPE